MIDLCDTLEKKLLFALKNTFHFSQFRPGQLEAIMSLMTHGQLLCIQPTGHGKSLLYQLPSVLLDGITVVISPLLALMRDQLSQLKNRFDIPAGSINSDQSESENYRAKQLALSNKLRILFISPEQLDNLERLDFLLKLPVALLVIDEAHCISAWGHDFRPSYRQIIQLVEKIKMKNAELKLLALTATANEKTAHDIEQQLSSSKTTLAHRESMDRPNIRLSILRAAGMIEKLIALSHVFNLLEGTGLVYCATRENTKFVAEYLISQGIRCTAYHAGMEPKLKQTIQENFIQDKYQVIVATNALGMGIDKSNLRYIIHFDMPGSLSAFYQEVGRAGRDGLPAEGILLYDASDAKIQRFFIDSAQPQLRHFSEVRKTIDTSSYPLTFSDLKKLTALPSTRLLIVVNELIEQKFLEKIQTNNQQVYRATEKKGWPSTRRFKKQHALKTAELKNMTDYAESRKKCLMHILRKALGDQNSNPCGRCGVCTDSPFENIKRNDWLEPVLVWLETRPRY